MTDKVQKIRNEIEKLKSNLMYGACSSQIAMETRCKEEAYNEVLAILDSMQEEPKECMYSKDNYTDEDRKVLCDGCEEECEFNKKEEPVSNDLEQVVEEIVDPTVLNAYGVKEIANRLRRTMIESVSEDLEQAIDTYLATYFGGEKEKQEWPFLKKMAIHFAEWQKQKDSIPVSEDLEEAANFYADTHMEWFDADNNPHVSPAFKAGANWQKQQILDCNTTLQRTFELGKREMKPQMMAKAVDATVHIDAGGYPYIPQMELYDYEKDIPLAKEGDKYKVILIKEDKV